MHAQFAFPHAYAYFPLPAGVVAGLLPGARLKSSLPRPVVLAMAGAAVPRRELVRDLAVVVLLQLGALGYGLQVMYVARPVVLALEGDRFRVSTANEVVDAELPQAPQPLRRLSLSGPVVVRTEAPTDADEKLEAIQRAMAGADLGMRPKYWRPWDATARKEALAVARPLGPLQQRYAARRADFDAAIAGTGRPAGQLRYLPLLSRHADWIVLLDAGSGEIAGFAPFNAY